LEININNWEKYRSELKDADEFVLDIPTLRGMEPYRKFREAVELIFGKYTFLYAQELTNKLGTYQVADEIVKFLRGSGVSLLEHGRVPFMSLEDYLNESLLESCVLRAWEMKETQNFFEKNELMLLSIQQSLTCLQLEPFWKKYGNVNDRWQQVELYNIISAHQNPILRTHVRHTRQQH